MATFWKSRTWKVLRVLGTLLGGYMMYTGATGRELVWKTGPGIVADATEAIGGVSGSEAGRWVLVIGGLLVFLTVNVGKPVAEFVQARIRPRWRDQASEMLPAQRAYLENLEQRRDDYDSKRLSPHVREVNKQIRLARDHWHGDPKSDAQVAARAIRSELRRTLTLLQAKASVVEQGRAAENEPGFRLDRTQWERYGEVLAQFPEPYEAADAAYQEIDRLNAEIAWLQGRSAPGKATGFGHSHDLPKACTAVEAAIQDLSSFLGETEVPPAAKLAPQRSASRDPSEMTPYERLRVLHLEGRLILQEMDSFSLNITRVLFSADRVAGWTTNVAREMQRVAPEDYGEWLEAVEMGRDAKGMAQRLEHLGGIMSRLKAKER